MNLEKLSSFGFDAELIKAWNRCGINETLPIQDEALQSGVMSGASLLVIAPTSSGKTFLGEMVAVNNALAGKKTLYLVPFKSIAEERFSELSERYGSNTEISIKCIISDRDHRSQDRDLLSGKYDVAILTYEKLTALLVSNRAMLDVCACVIIDEVQMIMDEGRGPSLELLLTKLKIIGNKCQILGLSAVLGDLNGFDNWLNVKAVRHNLRPVELRLGIVESTGEYNYVEWNSQQHKSERFRSGSIMSLVKELTGRGEQVLIVKSTLKSVEESAFAFATSLRLDAAATAIAQLHDEPDTETKDKLLKLLRHGVAFHHSDCELAERLAVEASYRNGEIKVLVSTTTLSMGVNLPCDNVILADSDKWTEIRGAWQEVPRTLAEVRNILGRAGRFKRTASFGRGILLAEDKQKKRLLTHRYFESQLLPVTSVLSGIDIDKRVLDVLATGFAQTQEELENFIFSTFAGLNWTTDDAKKQISKYIDDGVKKCIRYELAKISDEGKIDVTGLGRICAAKQCSLDSFQKLKEYVLETTVFDCLDVAFAAARTVEVKDSVKRIKWDDPNRNHSVRQRLNALFSEDRLVGLIQKVFSNIIGKKTFESGPEFSIASVCRDLIETHHFSKEICTAHLITGAQARQIADNVAWMTDAMSGIAEILRPELALKFQEVAICMQLRSPFSCRYLNDLPPLVSRDERIRIYDSGITTSEEFILKVPNDFKGIMSPTKADYLIKSLLSSRSRNSAFWEKDHKRRLDILGFRTEEISAIYTSKGRDLEKDIKNLFDTGFTNCKAESITDQKSGEPDLILVFPDGKRGCVQITAKDDNAHYVDSKKSGDVLPQSARFNPHTYICIGRPDFQALAIEQASHIGKAHNFKLIPVYILAEIYVRFREGKIKKEEATKLLFEEVGYVNITRINNYCEGRTKSETVGGPIV